MLKKILCCLLVVVFSAGFAGCGKSKVPKIGVSFGVGSASRCVSEEEFMKKRAEEIGASIEVRLNIEDETITQEEDCKELIDSGIDVLILTPRDANNVSEILKYAKKKKVKVISYARIVLGQKIDLYIGYDSYSMGQMMGQYLSEMVYHGNYMILRGDGNDKNAKLLYDGAMSYIDMIKDDINIIFDAEVSGWSPEEAKHMVELCLKVGDKNVDAILAPNDKIAGACAEAIAEAGITTPVVITGKDADLSALRRIVAGTQSMTIYLDLEELAYTAVDQAYNMAVGNEIVTNSEVDNQSGELIKSNLIKGKVVDQKNIDNVIIASNYYTYDQVYGNN